MGTLDLWRNCPRCTSELDHRGEPTNPFVACPQCGFFRYDNPLPTTIGLIHHARRVLLLRRCVDPGAGLWDAVGGFLEPGESAEDCLRREAAEEVGLALAVLHPIGTYPGVYGSTGLGTLGIAYACPLPAQADVRLSEENDAHGWFAADDLPPIALDDVRHALADFFATG